MNGANRERDGVKYKYLPNKYIPDVQASIPLSLQRHNAILHDQGVVLKQRSKGNVQNVAYI